MTPTADGLDGADIVRVGFTDLHGVPRGKDVPVEAFDGVREHGIGCTEAIMTTGLRHNVVAGFEHGFRDLAVVPDLDTMRARAVGARAWPGAWPTSTTRSPAGRTTPTRAVWCGA